MAENPAMSHVIDWNCSKIAPLIHCKDLQNNSWFQRSQNIPKNPEISRNMTRIAKDRRVRRGIAEGSQITADPENPQRSQ